jgi:hypothetical protein
LFLATKTIDPAVGTEKDDKKFKESQKLEEKINKKRISREKHHDQVVTQ